MKEQIPYKTIDLVALFNKEKVDLKSILNSRKTKNIVSSGIQPYSGVWGNEQKKHLLNRSLMGYAHRHFKDLEHLNLDQDIRTSNEFVSLRNVFYTSTRSTCKVNSKSNQRVMR